MLWLVGTDQIFVNQVLSGVDIIHRVGIFLDDRSRLELILLDCFCFDLLDFHLRWGVRRHRVNW